MTAVGSRVALAACVLMLATPLASAGPREEDPAIPVVLPATIQVDTLLEAVVGRMLEKSPTFRRQCREIAAARIVVAVRLVPVPKDSSARATSTLRRYSSGLMVAHVEIPAATEPTQLIAHEFEHITEFIEGVDLDALVADRPSEASRRLDGAYETGRAVTAGRTVRAELSQR